MTLDTLFQILDRYGFPTAALAGVLWCAILMIKGPVNTFAGALAGKIGKLVDATIDFMVRAASTLGQLPGQIAAEGGATRAAVTAAAVEIKAAITTEGASIREHVTQSAGAGVTLVQLAEPASTSAPTAQPSGGPPPLPMPEPRATLATVPEGTSKPRPQLITLPSASTPAPVSEPLPA